MMAVMGVTGQVGSAVAGNLLGLGMKVRAIVREPHKGAVWAERGCEITFSARNQRSSYASEVAPGMTASAIGHMLKKIFAASDALRRHADSRRRHWRLGGLTKI